MEDLRPQLLGRGTYGPLRSPRRAGPMHLWDHVSMPPAQNSVIIYKDGSVLEGNNFQPWEIENDEVYLFILGGTNWRCGDDQFAHDSLIAAGYTCGFGTDIDVYTEQYTEEYPLEGST